jgi:hypothetical protein
MVEYKFQGKLSNVRGEVNERLRYYLTRNFMQVTWCCSVTHWTCNFHLGEGGSGGGGRVILNLIVGKQAVRTGGGLNWLRFVSCAT